MRNFILLFTLFGLALVASSCEDKLKQEAEYYSNKMKELEESQYMNNSYGDPEHIGQVKGVDGKWYDVNDNQAYISDTFDSYRNNGDLYDDSSEKKQPKVRRHDDGF